MEGSRRPRTEKHCYRPLAPLVLLLLLLGSDALAQGIYGIHDFDPDPSELLSRLEARGVRGTVVATEAIGHDASDRSGKDFRRVASRGHRVICRLNNGYFPNGTIPLRSRWPSFARRSANFAAASRGCTIWVIGNETNLSGEWPSEPGGYRRYISPEDYAECFRLVYDEIKAVRPSHQVIPQALAPFAGPYGAGPDHDGMPMDHVTYMRRMLDAIRRSGGIDGIALHINSRGYRREDVFSTQKVNGNYWSFFCYKDWIERGIPRALWHLPVHATESNGYFFWKGGHPEDASRTYERGWVETVLFEVDRWNHNEAVLEGKPPIRSVSFYRWCAFCDGWNIDGSPQKAAILADLDRAASRDLRWDDVPEDLEGPFVLTIERRTPPLQKDEPHYRGVWRSWVFRVPGSVSQRATFELTGIARANADDDDARLLVDGDRPEDDATWNTSAALDGSRDGGQRFTARFSRTLEPGEHSLRLQVDGTPWIDTIEVKVPRLPASFLRADANSDLAVDLADAIAILVHLFAEGGELGCPDAADADDNGRLEITDAVGLLGYLFLGNPAPAPVICGADATDDELAECSSPRC